MRTQPMMNACKAVTVCRAIQSRMVQQKYGNDQVFSTTVLRKPVRFWADLGVTVGVFCLRQGARVFCRYRVAHLNR